MSQNTACEELQDAAWAVMTHSDLAAVVLCGEMCRHQMRSIAGIHSSASLSVLMVPLLVVLNGHVGASSAAVTLMCDWRGCTQVATFDCSNGSSRECLNADNLLALGMAHATHLEPSAALAAIHQIACSMQQAPALGLQHCLQLTRIQTTTNSRVQPYLADSRTLHHPGALQSLHDHRAQPLSCYYERQVQSALDSKPNKLSHLQECSALSQLDLAQFSFPALLHKKCVVASGTAHFGVLQDQIGSTCALQRLACDALLDESWQPLQPPPASVLAGEVPVHDWLLPTVNSQLGILVDSLVILTHADDDCVVLELNDARHYNAMDLPLVHAFRSNLARLEANTVSRLHSVMLQGAGAHFCSGGAAHLDAVMPRVAPGSAAGISVIVKDMSSCVTMLQELSVPVLSVLHGKLTGGGVALALNTDWRVCTSAAKFNHGNLPRNHSPIGGFGGSLGSIVGSGRAILLYLVDVLHEGEQASSIGLADTVEIDLVSARHQTNHCARISHLQWCAHSKLEEVRTVPIENDMHGASVLENAASLDAVPRLGSASIVKCTRFVAGLEGLGQHELAQAVESMLLSKVHEVVSGTNITVEDPLMESGVDSLAATELLNLIQQELGQAAKLSSTLTFDYPTVNQVAAHIVSLLQPQQGTQRDSLTQNAVLDMVLSKVDEVVSGPRVGADDPLMESGVDSLAATELQNSLQRELGTAVKLPSTLTFDSPTAAEIAQFVKGQLLPQRTADKPTFHQTLVIPSNSNHLSITEQSCSQAGVSIAAMQGKTPADLCRPSSAWASLVCAHNTVSKIPACRFEQDAAHGALYGHFVDGHHTLVIDHAHKA